MRPLIVRSGVPVAAVAAGVCLPFALAPYDIWPLALVSAGALFWLLNRPDARPLRTGWLFGLGKYGVGVSWVYVSIHVHGDAAPPLAAFLVSLFVAGLALFNAAAAWLFVRFRVGGVATVNAIWFAAVWVLTEWLLTWFLTGFPWLFAGYAMMDTPLEPLAPIGGVLLVSFVAVLTATCLIAWRSPSALVVAALPWFACWALAGASWTTLGRSHSVALVQGNIAQEEKWLPQNRDMILARYAELSEAVWDREVVIWPEAAIPLAYHQAGTFLKALAARMQGTLVLGIPIIERSSGSWSSYNGAIAVGAGEGRYLKQRLVPFGEYVPLETLLRGLIKFFDLPMSGFSTGEPGQPLLRADGVELAMSICYEIIYPGLVREQATGADALVTISNDTWFGASIGPLQHMQMARMRALENGRYLLRATNNGVTAIVDERGRVTAALPQFEQGVLSGEFKSVSGTTPFGRWGSSLVVVPLILFLAGVIGGTVAGFFNTFDPG